MKDVCFKKALPLQVQKSFSSQEAIIRQEAISLEKSLSSEEEIILNDIGQASQEKICSDRLRAFIPNLKGGKNVEVGKQVNFAEDKQTFVDITVKSTNMSDVKAWIKKQKNFKRIHDVFIFN